MSAWWRMPVSIVALGWWCPQIVLTATTVRLPTLRSQDFDTNHAVTIALRPERQGCEPPPEVAAILRLCCGLRRVNRVYSPGWQPDECGAGRFAPPRLRPSCNLGTTSLTLLVSSRQTRLTSAVRWWNVWRRTR